MLQNAGKRPSGAAWPPSTPRSPATAAQATGRKLKCYRMQAKGHLGLPGIPPGHKIGFKIGFKIVFKTGFKIGFNIGIRLDSRLDSIWCQYGFKIGI